MGPAEAVQRVVTRMTRDLTCPEFGELGLTLQVLAKSPPVSSIRTYTFLGGIVNSETQFSHLQRSGQEAREGLMCGLVWVPQALQWWQVLATPGGQTPALGPVLGQFW